MKFKKLQTTKSFATEKLSKQNIRDEYIIKLQNRFNVLQDHQELEDQWKMISESIVMYYCRIFSLFYVLCHVTLPLMLCVKIACL